MDSQMLARTLEDVNASVIPTNYALRADLKPARALAREDTNSDFANVIVVRKGSKDKKAFQALKEAMCSEKMRAHIEEKYKGAIVSVF